MTGAYVLVVGYAARVSRFDAATGAPAWTTDGVEATCTPISVLFDDREVAYVGTYDGKLVTLDATSGTVLDEVTLLTGDGSGTDTIVVGLSSYQGYFCAAVGNFLVGCDATKGPLWQYPMQGLAWGNPAVVNDEALIVAGSFDAAVHAVAFDGTPVWTATQEQFFSAVPVVHRGVVYVAAGTKACGLDLLQGQVLWTEVGNAVTSYQQPHVLHPREEVFYASASDLIEARRLDDGGLVWEQPLPHSPGPLARDRVDLYFATHTPGPDQPYLFKHVGPDQIWQSDVPVGDPGHLPSTPVPDRENADGNVFLTSTDGNVYAFRKRDGTLVWQEDSGGISGVPPALVHPAP